MIVHPKANTIPVLAYASSLAGNTAGAECGPSFLQQSSYFNQNNDIFQWVCQTQTIAASPTMCGAAALDAVATICTELAQYLHTHSSKTPYLALGGDHSMAIGTWSGLASAYHGDLGLLWIDAHFDSHTPKSSHSRNIHGMPVAALLGHGDPKLTQIITKRPKIKAQNICFVGIRDYEDEEKQFLDQLGVRYYDMNAIAAHGLQHVMQAAMQHISQHSQQLGISIDLDAIDPTQAPGVSVPAADGIDADELIASLQQLRNHPHFNRLRALEIAEFNPSKDHNGNTASIIQRIIETCLLAR